MSDKPTRRPPNLYPYNMLSVEEGEAFADANAREQAEKKAKADAERRRAREAQQDAEARRNAFTSQYGQPSVKQPMVYPYVVPAHEVMERDRIIANERRLVRERENPRTEKRRAERPYVYKPEPLPGPPPPSATGREYTYNPRDKQRKRKYDLPRGYRTIGNPPSMDVAPRDWSGFSEKRARPYEISNALVDAYVEGNKGETTESVYTGKEWRIQGKAGGLVKVYISNGFLNDTYKLRGEEGWNDADPAFHVDAMDLNTDMHVRLDQVQGQLWGTDVYTDDSDIGAMLVHDGHIRWDESRLYRDRLRNPSATGIIVEVRLLPPLVRYYGSCRRGVRSRGWGNSHDGLSMRIEKVYRSTPNTGGRRGLKMRLREQALQRAIVEQPAVVGEWIRYEELGDEWMDRELVLLGKDGKRFTIRRDGDAFVLNDTRLDLDDVYFLPAGLAYREDDKHGKLVPIVGYQCIAKKLTDSEKEARNWAGTLKADMPAEAEAVVDGAVEEWSRERGNELVKRGWTGALERDEVEDGYGIEMPWPGELQ